MNIQTVQTERTLNNINIQSCRTSEQTLPTEQTQNSIVYLGNGASI